MDRPKYYPGTTKKVTDPFLVLRCRCGYAEYSIYATSAKCPRCGGQLLEKESV